MMPCNGDCLCGGAQPLPPEDPAITAGRRAREQRSIDWQTYCLMHRRPLRWMPAPAWWIHDDRLHSVPETCMGMWNAKAPPGEEK